MSRSFKTCLPALRTAVNVATFRALRGQVVKRHLRDGDPLLVNRQPTLHKPGIMAHKAKVLRQENTIRPPRAVAASIQSRGNPFVRSQSITSPDPRHVHMRLAMGSRWWRRFLLKVFQACFGVMFAGIVVNVYH